MATTKKPMAESSKKVLAFLKAAGVGVKFTANEVKDALEFEKVGSVTGSITNFVKKGWAERFEEEGVDENGKPKTIKKFALTEQGMSFDPATLETPDAE